MLICPILFLSKCYENKVEIRLLIWRISLEHILNKVMVVKATQPCRVVNQLSDSVIRKDFRYNLWNLNTIDIPDVIEVLPYSFSFVYNDFF